MDPRSHHTDAGCAMEPRDNDRPTKESKCSNTKATGRRHRKKDAAHGKRNAKEESNGGARGKERGKRQESQERAEMSNPNASGSGFSEERKRQTTEQRLRSQSNGERSWRLR